MSGSTTATLGDVVGVDADELADLLGVGDHVVDRDLGRGAGGGGHGDGEARRGSWWVRRPRGSARRRTRGSSMMMPMALAVSMEEPPPMVDDAVGLGRLVRLDAVLDVLDGGVGLDLGVELTRRYPAASSSSVTLAVTPNLTRSGSEQTKAFLKPRRVHLARDLLDGALAVIADGVEDKTISHANSSVARKIGRPAVGPRKTVYPAQNVYITFIPLKGKSCPLGRDHKRRPPERCAGGRRVTIRESECA